MNDKTLNEVIEIQKDTIKTLQAEIEFWRNHAHGLRAEAQLWQAKAQRGDERFDALVAEVERLRAALRGLLAVYRGEGRLRDAVARAREVLGDE